MTIHKVEVERNIKIYISGKITGLCSIEAKANFDNAAKALKIKNLTPINPMDLVPFIAGWTWEQYMIEDIKLIFDCQALFMLDNWQDSKGAKVEHAIAAALGKIIIYDIKEIA